MIPRNELYRPAKGRGIAAKDQAVVIITPKGESISNAVVLRKPASNTVDRDRKFAVIIPSKSPADAVGPPPRPPHRRSKRLVDKERNGS